MKNKILLIIQVILIVALVPICVFATAGGIDDPLVSKSYVDDKLNQLMDIIKNMGESNSNENSETDNTDNTVGEVSEPLIYTPVFVEVGKTILGHEGTEIILRSGIGSVVTVGADGITNLTKGIDLVEGENVEKNNLLIIPREDGRGIKVTSSAWFLVKGGYTIK